MKRARPLKRGRQELEEDTKPKIEKRGKKTKEESKVKDMKIEVKESDNENTAIKNKNEESESDNSFKENEDNRISEFEKMVQKNREERIAFLQSLKIDEVKEEFKEAVIGITPKPKLKRHIKKADELIPIRKSRRLAKLDIEFSKEIKALPSKYSFKDAINENDNLSDFVSNFDFSISENKKYNTNYAAHFKQMIIKESAVARVVPTYITSLAFHPATDRVMVIAGSKCGHLGFWNVTSRTDPTRFHPHTSWITNLKINPYNELQIITSSYDGTLRCGDMKKKSFNAIFNVSCKTSCTYFDFVSASTFLVSQKNGKVSVVDVRNDSLKSEKKHECHEYSVKTVHTHPVNKNLFLTADSRGSIKLWDLRKLQKKSLIDVSLNEIIESAFFSPVTGNFILTSAYGSLGLFDSSNLKKEILFKKSVKLRTISWPSPFKATWLPNSDDLFAVGSVYDPRRIEIFNTDGSNVYNFVDDEYMSSITPINEFHPSLNVLAGGSSIGKVLLFGDKELNL